LSDDLATFSTHLNLQQNDRRYNFFRLEKVGGEEKKKPPCDKAHQKKTCWWKKREYQSKAFQQITLARGAQAILK
jgi:hypothetical protein